MRKAVIEGRKRDEIEQFTALANLLRPRPGVEWPTPEDVDKMELEISRSQIDDLVTLEQRRDALLDPPWKAAVRRFPPRAGDPGIDARNLRGYIVMLRRPPALYAFHTAVELYRAAWVCRKVLVAIAKAAEAETKLPLNLDLPPAQPRVQLIAGALKSGPDFYQDFFMDALEDFDATLIRVCDCGLIYIAKRRAQSGCSKRCANRQRQQAFRKKHPAYHRRHARVGRILEAFRRAITVVATIPEPFPEVT
jgi:hypothetical protein